MKRCEHPYTYREVHRFPAVPDGHSLWVTKLYCSVCNTYLPLGPSNDEPEAVQIEIRAASLAADPHGVGHVATTREWLGWLSVRNGLGTSFVEHDGELQAGWLAGCIATHEDP